MMDDCLVMLNVVKQYQNNYRAECEKYFFFRTQSVKCSMFFFVFISSTNGDA